MIGFLRELQESREFGSVEKQGAVFDGDSGGLSGKSSKNMLTKSDGMFSRTERRSAYMTSLGRTMPRRKSG
jgi:hypothetical protein